MPKLFILASFRKPEACGQTVLPDTGRQVSFNKTRIGGKCQKSKIQMGHYDQISNNMLHDRELETIFSILFLKMMRY